MARTLVAFILAAAVELNAQIGNLFDRNYSNQIVMKSVLALDMT